MTTTTSTNHETTPVPTKVRKSKATSAKENPEVNSGLKVLVDEFGELHNRLAVDMDRYEELKKKLAVFAGVDQSDEAVTLEGNAYKIDYSAPSMSDVCTLEPQAFVKATGAWGALSISVTEAKKVLTAEQLTKYFVKKRGSRRFKRVRL